MGDTFECDDLGTLGNGCHLYRKTNEVGGNIYFSDEIGGGVVVWDTTLVSEDTLLASICCEHNERYIEHVDSIKPHIGISERMQDDKSAATGCRFIPEQVVKIDDRDESIPDALKILAIKCYLAYNGVDRTHNVKEATVAQFDECNGGWQREWLRVARVIQ